MSLHPQYKENKRNKRLIDRKENYFIFMVNDASYCKRR